MPCKQTFQDNRIADDHYQNKFGEQLIEFCSINNCIILNGLRDSDYNGGYTCIQHNGSSVVDYFISSIELMNSLCIDKIKIEDEIFSDHLPLVMSLRVRSMPENITSTNRRKPNKIKWNNDKTDNYITCLYSEESNQKILCAKSMIDKDINNALHNFNECLLAACSSMKKGKRKKKNMKTKIEDWKDKEYNNKRKITIDNLTAYKNSKEDRERYEFLEAKKHLKNMKRCKKENSEKHKAQILMNKLYYSKYFWTDVKMIIGNKTPKTIPNISLDQWKSHFEDVFTNKNDQQQQENIEVDTNEHHTLDFAISHTEVATVISKLKRGKASGTDCILPEMLKHGGPSVIDFLTTLFNHIFNTGKFPEEWSKSIIVPIHKKGSKDNPNNYRGISLINVIAKCYTSVLNKRLYSWLELNNKICEQQAGFREKYSTTDHIFVLYSIIQKCMTKNGQKLYVAFIDMSKAFDCVKRDLLFKTMEKEGIKGKFLRAIMSIYHSVKTCVRIPEGELTEFFECTVGLKQGCNLSPTLFSLFINSLSNIMTSKGKHGLQLLPGLIELFILLFADDIVLMSLTPVGLQNQLNVLKSCCDNLNLQVNEEKTKIMVFRKGGVLRENEKWTYGGKRLEIVNRYSYLGYVFSTKLSINIGTYIMTQKARKAHAYLSKLLIKCKYVTIETYFKIFDAKIIPMLTYASEVWGLTKLDSIERIQMMSCKRFLGLPITTPNKMALGELGRLPIYITAYIRCIKFWLRIMQLPDKRITKQAYQMLLQMDERGNNCWVSEVRNLLSNTGFYFVWLYQGTGNIEMFLQTLKQRLIDMYKQDWNGTIRDSDRYEDYRQYKSLLEPEKYLTMIDNRPKKIAFTMARTNMLPINANLYRHKGTDSDKDCLICKGQVENERHVMYVCPMYTSLRKKFLGQLAELPIQVLLNGQIKITTYKVSAYLLHCMNLRKDRLGK